MSLNTHKLIATFALTAAGLVGAQAATVTVSCGATAASNFETCKRHSEAWAKKTGNSVEFFSTPASTTDTLALYRQVLGAKSADIDVLMIDVIWPGLLKGHLTDLKPYSKGAEKGHFAAMVLNNTSEGKLLGMPWYIDAGLLFYRKDLLTKHGLKVPQTWDDLTLAAKKVQDAERSAGSADFHGFVFQAKAYEGLTCNVLEWVASSGGGEVVDSAGNVTINNPNAVKALNTAASWVGSIAPTGVLNYAEEEARGVFHNGNALFMRAWPYVWKLSQASDSPIRDKVGVAPLPKGEGGGKSAATLGGRQLAVSMYSKNKDAAADLVMFLTSAEMQKDRAVTASIAPSRPDLYKDKEVVTSNPFLGDLYPVLVGGVARPSTVTGLKYPEVSNALWDATHDVLSKKASAAESLKKLEGKLNQIKRGKW